MGLRVLREATCAPLPACPAIGMPLLGRGCPDKTSPQPRPSAPLAPAGPGARARSAWKPRPSGGPSSGKVSTTFPGAAPRARGGRVTRPPRVVTRRPSRAALGLLRHRSLTCARCRPSVRAGPARGLASSPEPRPAARPPAHPERHHELAIQEEKQRQIQPRGADPEVRRRPHAAPRSPGETRVLGGALGRDAPPGAWGNGRALRAAWSRGSTAQEGPGDGGPSQECATRANAGPVKLESPAWWGWGWGWGWAGVSRGKTLYLAPENIDFAPRGRETELEIEGTSVSQGRSCARGPPGQGRTARVGSSVFGERYTQGGDRGGLRGPRKHLLGANGGREN